MWVCDLRTGEYDAAIVEGKGEGGVEDFTSHLLGLRIALHGWGNWECSMRPLLSRGLALSLEPSLL